jgi:hypothetical protein
MKKLALVTLVLLLNGCAVIDAYRMARFDNNEYMIVNQIHTQAQLGAVKCGTKDVVPYVDDVYNKSVELKNYSSGIARNEEAVTMAENLLAITKGLKDRYDAKEETSQKFCEMKFGMIENGTKMMQSTIGAKPR